MYHAPKGLQKGHIIVHLGESHLPGRRLECYERP